MRTNLAIWGIIVLVLFAPFPYLYRTRKRGRMDVIYMSGTLFFGGCLFYFLGAAAGFAAIWRSNLARFVIALLLLCAGVTEMLCQLNKRIRMTSAETFDFYNFLGMKREYSIRDFIRIRSFPGDYGFWLIMDEGRIYVNDLAVVSAAFLERLKSRSREQEADGKRRRERRRIYGNGMRRWMGLMGGKESRLPNWRNRADLAVMILWIRGFFELGRRISVRSSRGMSCSTELWWLAAAAVAYIIVSISLQKLNGLFHEHYTMTRRGIQYEHFFPPLMMYNDGCMRWDRIERIELRYYHRWLSPAEVRYLYIYCKDGERSFPRDILSYRVTRRIRDPRTGNCSNAILIMYTKERYEEMLKYCPPGYLPDSEVKTQ